MQAFFAPSIVEGLFCTSCGKNSNFIQNKKFLDYPRHLLIVLQRFVMDEWVPKKLEVSLEFDPSQNFDFNRFLGLGLQAGENPMPEEAASESVEPELDM